MKKKFNIAGVCYPHLHYMMDNSAKVGAVLALVEEGEYFTINRPRQYGKSTTLQFLEEALTASEGYQPIRLNFQGIDEQWHRSDSAFAKMFVREMHKSLEAGTVSKVTDMNSLSDFITELVRQLPKKLVLIIDEVDASSNYAPFLNFLGMLRTKYLERFSPRHATFHSVVLAGVYDIKSLKYKLRDPEAAQFNSPWNIAVDFKVEMAFNPREIAPMLEQYSQTEGVPMDIRAIAERLYYYTSGYPFLVTRLCKIIAEDMLPGRPEKSWSLSDVEEAVQWLLKEDNTNFDSLIKNLENHPDLYDLTREVILEGTVIPFSPDEPVMKLGRIYGVFKDNGRLKIHNRIYEQRLYNYMTVKKLRMLLQSQASHFGDTQFINQDNALNLEGVLRKFQQFMKEQRSQKDLGFLEREWRLVFLSFLKPIINGKGYDFKEVEISEEKRLDVVVTFYQHKYIIELKLWRGPKQHEKGLDQLVDYLDIHGVEKGWLIIFDDRKKPSFEVKTILHKGKEVFAVWV